MEQSICTNWLFITQYIINTRQFELHCKNVLAINLHCLFAYSLPSPLVCTHLEIFCSTVHCKFYSYIILNPGPCNNMKIKIKTLDKLNLNWNFLLNNILIYLHLKVWPRPATFSFRSLAVLFIFFLIAVGFIWAKVCWLFDSSYLPHLHLFISLFHLYQCPFHFPTHLKTISLHHISWLPPVVCFNSHATHQILWASHVTSSVWKLSNPDPPLA